MNNFLTRLVARNSGMPRSPSGGISVVKPRIGSRFENRTDLSTAEYQANEINEEAYSPAVPPSATPGNNAPQAFSPGMEAAPQPRQANAADRQAAPLLNNAVPVRGETGDESIHRQQRANNAVETSARALPPTSHDPEVLTPDAIPALTKGEPDKTGIDRNTHGNEHRTARPLPEQTPQAVETDQHVSAQTNSDARLSDTAQVNVMPTISTRIVQTKMLAHPADTMAGKTVTHSGINQTSPGLPDSQPDRAELRSTAPTLPETPTRFTATGMPEQLTATEIAGAHQDTENALPPVINTRVELFESHITVDHPADFSASRGTDSPIIHGHELDRRDTERAAGNSLPAFQARLPGNETAQPPTIKVSIGRIEVRATSPAPQAQPAAPIQRPRRGPAVSLSDYLKSKGGQS